MDVVDRDTDKEAEDVFTEHVVEKKGDDSRRALLVGSSSRRLNAFQVINDSLI